MTEELYSITSSNLKRKKNEVNSGNHQEYDMLPSLLKSQDMV
jgi:hypothetical protein